MGIRVCMYECTVRGVCGKAGSCAFEATREGGCSQEPCRDSNTAVVAGRER